MPATVNPNEFKSLKIDTPQQKDVFMAKLAALLSQVITLQSQVATLQSQVTTLQAQVYPEWQ